LLPGYSGGLEKINLKNTFFSSFFAVTALCSFLFFITYLSILYRTEIWESILICYDFISSRDKIQNFITSFHGWAPVIFILFQLLQVLFAPVPGEATGFIGGYLFGAFQGFFYSCIGLTIGSWINFMIGRFFGKKYIRKWISQRFLNRFEPLLKRQGIFVLLILFIFPGFPKDYLCLFLGMTVLPIKVFMIISTVGRMPGTLMLSLQGSYVFDQLYELFMIIFGISMVVVFLTYRFRKKLYGYMERLNHKSPY
jgi:uncharacterized membrane protein YdjX (TVP38/TMEM64 family)